MAVLAPEVEALEEAPADTEAVDEPVLPAAVAEAAEAPEVDCVPGVRGAIVETPPLTETALLTSVTEAVDADAEAVEEDPDEPGSADELEVAEDAVEDPEEPLSAEELEEDDEAEEDDPDEFEDDDEVPLLLDEAELLEELLTFIATVQFLTSWTASWPLESLIGVKVMTQVCVSGPAGVMELVTVITVVGAAS